MSEDQADQPQQSEEASFSIEQIYLKDVSLETPNTPAIFNIPDWKPQVELDLHTSADKIEEHLFEVTLRVTVAAKQQDKTAFLIEVNQAGMFYLKGVPKPDAHHLLGSYCPSVLYPYAREVISSLVIGAGFPRMYLSPINFEAYFQEKMAQSDSDGEQQAQSPSGDALH